MTLETDYQNALDYLYSYVDYSLTRAFRYSPEKFDLGRMARLMSFMGDPQEKYRKVHVTGTKGKGSTSVMIASALQAAGYRVGFYSSPHLEDFTERIQVNHKTIHKEAFCELVEEIKNVAPRVSEVTTFELATAMAFQYFAQKNVDFAVIEVGLGGRLDATNVVVPDVSVITSISIDHVSVLGDTVQKIAIEKGGIIKPHKPVVVAPQSDEALKVLVGIAHERNSPVIEVGKDYLFAPWAHTLDRQSLLVWPSNDQPLVDEFIESGGRSIWEPIRLNIPLLGHHQVENAATAYTTLKVLESQGVAIGDQAIRRGFSDVFWPGRFEVLRKKPGVIVDSAHNRDSAHKLRVAIDDYLPGQSITLIFGASEDKDLDGMFRELMPRMKRVIATKSTHPRAMDTEEIVNKAHQLGRPALAIEDIEEALRYALTLSDEGSAIVVTGSLFVVAAVRAVWKKWGYPIREFECDTDDISSQKEVSEHEL
ncbi:MAG: bifunctional folylpolyglutamate synthase/dihydrofolate synthase [Anaerolineae bacterium]|nr:bifunctional folylpolyglutamate synthase/dihydrofolate synthase [Anaerolineae bacterium]